MPNRLINETSPYLLQHSHNPVEWYPWGQEALSRAKAENKVILVSIGYSACHWCHVMERESFENDETASLMNDYFVNIKIDREERPDLDQVYMDAVQLLSGSGGWPLNCFLTPDAKPFYGGTYFPPVKTHNRSSWTDVIIAINQAWTNKKHEVEEQAESLTSHLKNSSLFSALEKNTGEITADDLKTISDNIMKNADTAWGGFGKAPKFPQTFTLGFLINQAWYEAGQKVNQVLEPGNKMLESAIFKQALLSLDKMIMGGIYDQIGGGFARYSTDARWLVPHFEKMLYDNALLVGILAEAYQVTRKEGYRLVIEKTIRFIKEEWQDKDGGFFSAFDADSEGEEGKFYTWSRNEIEEILDPEAADIFIAFYGIEEFGNWEHTNILWVEQAFESFSKARGIEPKKAKILIEKSAEKLLKVRAMRPKPLLDDKKLLGWNAMMITACCKAWAATGNGEYLEMACRDASFIEAKLQSSPGSFHHNYKEEKAANPAFLDDLALYIESLCHLQECTGETFYLEKARILCERVLTDFLEEQSGLFYFTHALQQDIIFRKKEIYDGATASGNSLMAKNLFYLGIILDKPGWKEHAVKMISTMKKLVVSYPTSFGNWALMMQWLVYGVKEIAIVGSGHNDFSPKILNAFWPNKILQHAATNNEFYPLLANRNTKGDETSFFLCFNFSCLKPVKNPEAFFVLVNEAG